MSLAGRPTARDQIRRATVGSINYVCRLLSTHGYDGAHVMHCATCDSKVIFTPSVLADKKALAHSLGRNLRVICDVCCVKLAEERSIVFEFPSDVERAEARRIGGRG